MPHVLLGIPPIFSPNGCHVQCRRPEQVFSVLTCQLSLALLGALCSHLLFMQQVGLLSRTNSWQLSEDVVEIHFCFFPVNLILDFLDKRNNGALIQLDFKGTFDLMPLYKLVGNRDNGKRNRKISEVGNHLDEECDTKCSTSKRNISLAGVYWGSSSMISLFLILFITFIHNLGIKNRLC